MKAKHENPFSTLSELELNSQSEQDLISEKEIRAELRFSEDQIDVGSYDITVALSEATLFVMTSGSTIAPGSRLAEKSRLSEEYTQTTRRRATAQRAISADASLSITNSSASLGTEAESSSTHEEEVEVSRVFSNRYVRPSSGNRWIISEGDRESGSRILNSTYIANEVLCRVSPTEKANTIGVEAVVLARKRDLVITADGNPLQRELRERVHKTRFIKAIIGKSLSEHSSQSDVEKNRGAIILSRSTLGLEDNAP